LTEDLKRIDVPTLIIHGDDRIVPIDASARRSVELVKDATLKVYPGAPTACSLPTRSSSTFDGSGSKFQGRRVLERVGQLKGRPRPGW
jgi:hypothetical protein